MRFNPHGRDHAGRRLLRVRRWSIVLLLMVGPASAESAAGIGNFVLYGEIGADLGGASRVDRGDVASNGFVRGRQDSWFGGDVLADFVSLDRNSMVSGDARYNRIRQGQGVEIGGHLITPIAIPLFAGFPELADAVPGDETIRVEAGQKRRLRAGHYGRIEVGAGARVIFLGGEVHAESLTTEEGAEILFRRPTLLHVAAGVQLGEDCVVAGLSYAKASDVVIHLSGPGFILARSRCRIEANLIAPQGLVSIVDRVELTGAALAWRVVTGDEVVIDHLPAFDPTFELRNGKRPRHHPTHRPHHEWQPRGERDRLE